MPVGKRIYLKRQMPDPKVVAGFKKIPASNTADCMERNCAMNPRIKLMSNPVGYSKCSTGGQLVSLTLNEVIKSVFFV